MTAIISYNEKTKILHLELKGVYVTVKAKKIGLFYVHKQTAANATRYTVTACCAATLGNYKNYKTACEAANILNAFEGPNWQALEQKDVWKDKAQALEALELIKDLAAK